MDSITFSEGVSVRTTLRTICLRTSWQHKFPFPLVPSIMIIKILLHETWRIWGASAWHSILFR